MTQRTEHYVALYRDEEAIGMVIIKSPVASDITHKDVIHSLEGTPLEGHGDDITWKVLEPEEAMALANEKANDAAVRGICPVCVAEGMVGEDAPSDTVKTILSKVINAGTEGMRMSLCDKHVAAAHKMDGAWLIADAYHGTKSKFMPTQMDLIPVDMMDNIFERNEEMQENLRKHRMLVVPEWQYRQVKARVWVVTIIEAAKFIATDMRKDGLDDEAKEMIELVFSAVVPFFKRVEDTSSDNDDITNEAPASIQ
jgi:hypothetical protein